MAFMGEKRRESFGKGKEEFASRVLSEEIRRTNNG